MIYLEEVVNMVPGSTILNVGVRILPHHVIDGVHNVCHLLDGQRGEKETSETSPSPRAANTTLIQTEREGEWFKNLSGDAAIFVEIIQIKGPVEFISDGASQDDGQTYNKVLHQDKESQAMIRKL